MSCAPQADKRVEMINGGGLENVAGMRGGAVAAGIKPSNELDVAIIDASIEMTAVAVFTRNKLAAAPVHLCRERLNRRAAARTIVINAGNANAMTGAQGDADAKAMIERLEQKVGGPALVLSTGIIGVPMPMDKVLAGIDGAAERLSKDGLAEVAKAIMTTDTRPKTSAATVVLPAEGNSPEQRVTVGGVAKGSGMIHPNMATMLGVIATDAPLEPGAARTMLRSAVDDSFNSITVDGDTSTNDTVLMLSGGAQIPPIPETGPRYDALYLAVHAVATDLARQIVKDGEGAKRFAQVKVTGAASKAEAKKIAESIARSSLVKTALAGGDPNWGRILAAAANADIDLDVNALTLTLGGIRVFEGGHPTQIDQKQLDDVFGAEEVNIELDLRLGKSEARMFTTDLTKEYVEINSEYTT